MARQNQLNESDRQYQRAIQLIVRVFGDRHPVLAPVLVEHATVYHKMNEFPNAQPLLMKAASILDDNLDMGAPQAVMLWAKIMQITYGNGKKMRGKGMLGSFLDHCSAAPRVFDTQLGKVCRDLCDFLRQRGFTEESALIASSVDRRGATAERMQP